ncbi:RHS repeat domain-containing protein, partial [Micromonospora orduensis]|uniref:RHS repeat domain-containing protein n=1 Tax=Micromonospora orduensis TaxID=1420891 RepID=UPI0033DC01CC
MPTETSADGTVVDYDSNGRPVRQQLPDGTVFDGFTADGKPTHATLPGNQDVSITYGGDGSSTWSYADGMKVSRDSSGALTHESTSDGASFDRFTADGRPTHGSVPGADGQPAQDVSISYRGDGSSSWTYADGTRVDRDAAGDVTHEITSDGASFDRFTVDGRPTHGSVPGVDGQPPQSVDISYGGDGSSTWTYADGTRVDRNAAGDVTREVTSDGASFDRFTADGRPTHGSVPGADGQPAQAVDISYGGDGSSTWTYADGTRVDRDAAGDITREVTSDGASFDRFTADGRPTHGSVPGADGQPPQAVDITYGGDGSSTWSYADGTRVSRDASGALTHQTTSDGASFDRFTVDGRPTHGSVPGADGQPPQSVDIRHGGDGSSTWTYADGTRVDRNAAGDVTREVTSDGASFDRFTADGRPTHGSVPGADGQPPQAVDISYGGDGSSTWTYADGTRVDRGAAGDVTREITSDGASFDRFTADGRPTHGSVPGADGQPAQDVSIAYGGDGSSTWTYADGTKVSRDASGALTHQTTSDGASFDRFTPDGRPTHGSVPGADGQPPQAVDISYGGDGSSTWTYADGTRVDRDAAGDITREITSDGASFDRFTVDGRPTHGSVPGVDGQPPQSVDITYGSDGSSTWTYADGTRVDRDAAGDVTRETTSDGASFDRFTADGRPTHGSVPGADGQPAQDVSISYGGDGSSTWSYADGTRVDRNAAGDVTREITSDGASFDRFTADGRPTHGSVPGADGQPAQAVDISYGGDGSSTWTYADGTRVDRDAAGDITREITSDGASFDRFTADGRPTHGSVPGADGQPPQDVSISYGGDGSSTWTYADGTKVDRNAAGDITREITSDGASFDRFTADGRPTHGTVPGTDGQPAQAVDISYGGDGSSTWTYADGTRVDRNAAGDVTREVTSDGASFDRFTVDGRPTHGSVPGADGQPPQSVDISYGGDGSSTWTYADGTKVDRNAAGDVTREVTSDGASFDRFTADGRPTHGSVPGVDGQSPQAVDISYGGDGSSTWTYADGTRVDRDAAGDITREITSDGASFDRFTADGRPTHGSVPGVDGQSPQAVDISYGGDGSSTWSYADGTRIDRDAAGDVTREVTSDGASFDRFTADGRPTHGSVPGADGQPAQDVSISYGGDGSSTWTYADGTRVDRNAAGDVTRETTSDGASFDRFTADGRPTHGSVPGADGQPAQDVDISYGGDGSTTWTYADGTRVDRNAAGDVTRETTSDGASFDRFTADGRPTHGTVPGTDGQPAQAVDITYGGDGSSTWTYADGTKVDRNAAGDITHETTSDGASFDRFTADGKPTH